MKIGILGGTFNPIHNAHLHIATAALEQCQLDRVLFLPAAIPPHKEIAEDISFGHRLAMVELAIADHPAFHASDLEARRPGASFSIDTLHLLGELYPGDDFYFIIGLDSFRDITTWKNYQQLFAMASIVVVRRPGPDNREMRQFLPVAIKDDFCYDEKSLKLRHKSGRALVFIDDTGLDISSTAIRDRTRKGLSISADVPAPVAAYIAQHDLYRKQRKAPI